MPYLMISIFVLAGCSDQKPVETALFVDTVAIAQDIKILSSDAFEGRKPFTNGEVKTIEYLQSQFKEIGLESGNGDSYFQKVPLIEITATPSDNIVIQSNGQSVLLYPFDDMMITTKQAVERIDIKNSELVFAGYGITAPEYDWSDFEGIEWQGKTAIVLVNDPGYTTQDSTLFKGNTMTYYGRYTYKYEEGERQGVDGVIIVHETAPAGYPWEVIRNSGSGAQLNLEDESGNSSKLPVEGWMTVDAARDVFEVCGLNFEVMKRLATEGNFKPVSLNATITMSIENKLKRDHSQNVIGVIKGSERPDETIVFSAHWDHLGISIPDASGDSIYNGAFDNASGTAQMMALARLFKTQPQPKRTLVFLSVTAEEQGLLGSQYYAENPIYPIDLTVANINMDGAAIQGEMNDFTITGYGHSEMDEMAEAAATRLGRYIIPDPNPEKGYFFRSDHFNFAKVGVPALYAKGVADMKIGGKEKATQWRADYIKNNYHKPSDEYDPAKFKMKGLVSDVRLLFDISDRLANSDYFPKWYESSEFSAIRN